MKLEIDQALFRLYQLAWHPGQVMHEKWWSRLHLDAWQPYYLSSSATACETHDIVHASTTIQNKSLCRSLDRLISDRRGYPRGILPGQLTSQQCLLLSLETRLPALLLALGLYCLGSPDYLLRGSYRRLLAPILGWHALDQLWTLWREKKLPPNIEPAEIVDQAQLCGQMLLTKQLKHDPVWLALEITLAPLNNKQPPKCITIHNSLDMFFRLARFL